MYKVAILTIPEALPYSVMGPLDVLRASAAISSVVTGKALQDPFVVELVGETDSGFKSYNGVNITPDASIQSEKQYDLIWIPSLILNPSGLFNTYKNVQRWLIKQFEKGADIVTVCTGAFLLAETGLLNGKQATTHWAYADLFMEKYPAVVLTPQLSVVENERIFCAAAGAAWHDMVMNILERQYGKKCAMETGKMFLLQYHHNGQKHLFQAQPQQHDDALIQSAERWLAAHLSEDNLISKVALTLEVTEATFSRRFKAALNTTPKSWIQSQRIAKAKDALELTNQSVEEISCLVGYQDSSFFRRLFKRETGLSPAQYRKQYQG